MMPLALKNIMVFYFYPYTPCYLSFFELGEFQLAMPLWNACDFFMWTILFVQRVLADHKVWRKCTALCSEMLHKHAAQMEFWTGKKNVKP